MPGCVRRTACREYSLALALRAALQAFTALRLCRPGGCWLRCALSGRRRDSPRQASYFFDSLALTLRASLRLLLPLVAGAKEVTKKA